MTLRQDPGWLITMPVLACLLSIYVMPYCGFGFSCVENSSPSIVSVHYLCILVVVKLQDVGPYLLPKFQVNLGKKVIVHLRSSAELKEEERGHLHWSNY